MRIQLKSPQYCIPGWITFFFLLNHWRRSNIPRICMLMNDAPHCVEPSFTRASSNTQNLIKVKSFIDLSAPTMPNLIYVFKNRFHCYCSLTWGGSKQMRLLLILKNYGNKNEKKKISSELTFYTSNQSETIRCGKCRMPARKCHRKLCCLRVQLNGK